MDKTFQQLGQLLFNSIPTILLFLVLHLFLKRVLYRPLQQVLAARRERIEGKQAAAAQTVAAAEQKLANYESALRDRRVENYRHIEAQRQSGLAEGQQALQLARHQSADAVTHARQQLAQQTAEAHTHLQAAAEALAAQIIAQVVHKQGNHVLAPNAAPGAGA